MWRMGTRDISKCADCRCDLFAASEVVPRLETAIQFVRQVTGKHLFICWRCAGERYKARQVKVC